jgi:hypothetical protein
MNLGAAFARLRPFLLVAGILLAAVAIPFAIWSPPVTYGVIHVESPEIYTRERLVNDRYNQDHWLRQRLEILDKVGDLSSGYLAVAVNVDARAALGAPETPPAAQPVSQQPDLQKSPPDGAMPLPFQEDLALRLSIRDFLRQQILENMLDDRHDLSGNTVFGLKFDTSIIPGSNTRSAAYVKATVSIYNYRNLVEPVDVEGIGRVKRYERNYYEGYREVRWKETPEFLLYIAWLKDFQARLNKVTSSIVSQQCQQRGAIQFTWNYAQEISRRVFSLVAGLEPGNVIVAKSPNEQESFYQVFPGELYNYVKASISASNVCSGGVGITVSPRIENLYMVDQKVTETKALSDAQRSQVSRILWSLNKDTYNFVKAYSPVDVGWRDPASDVCGIKAGSRYAIAMANEIDFSLLSDLLLDQEMELRELQYDVTDSLIALMAKFGARLYRSASAPPKARLSELAAGDAGVKVAYDGLALGNTHNDTSAIWAIIDATQPTCVVEFPLGFFNFIEKIAKSESYAYAVFPKSERKVFKLQELVRLAAGGGASEAGVGGISGMFGLAHALDSTDAAALSVGYGDGTTVVGPAKDDGTANPTSAGGQQGASFGWVVLPETDGGRLTAATLQPTQKSQLALVSVPAFAKDIIVRTETGWLDDEAQPIPEHRTIYEEQHIAVPTDFEAVDSLLAFSGANRRPLVVAGDVSPQMLLECAPAKILIPGFRLWQSTLVTIGSQQSEKITVLPNMEGIIADFSTIPHVLVVNPSPDPYKAINVPKTLPLRVWTSEGVTDPIPIAIEKGDCTPAPPSVSQQSASQGTMTP